MNYTNEQKRIHRLEAMVFTLMKYIFNKKQLIKIEEQMEINPDLFGREDVETIVVVVDDEFIRELKK